MTTLQRAASVLAGLFLLGAALVIFIPASPQDVTCGTWISPEWPEDESRALAEQALDLAEGDDFLGMDGQAEAIAMSAARNYRLCDDALDTRRLLSFVFLGLAIFTPAALLFIGAGRRDPS